MESDPTLGNAAEEAREESEPGATDEVAGHEVSNEEPESPAAEGETATANGELRAEDEAETASGDQDQREARTSGHEYVEREKPSAA
jgi:hypothetical protein